MVTAIVKINYHNDRNDENDSGDEEEMRKIISKNKSDKFGGNKKKIKLWKIL